MIYTTPPPKPLKTLILPKNKKRLCLQYIILVNILVPSEQTEGTWGEVSGLESTTTTSTTTTEPEPFYQIPAG